MFKRLFFSAMLALAVVALSHQAFGSVVLETVNENEILFQDRSVVLRPTGDPNDSYGGLQGWKLVPIQGGANPVLPQQFDVELMIFNAQNIDTVNGTIWAQSLGSDHLQGYAALEVQSVGLDPVSNQLLHVEFGPLSIADPFGILNTANNEMLALYTDTGATQWNTTAGTLQAAVDSVTDGNLWLTMGFPGVQGTGGYTYQQNLTSGGNPESGNGFGAWDVIQQPGMPGAIFKGVNDSTENLYGDPPGSGVVPLITDVWAQQKFQRNDDFPDSSLFQFESNDPMVIALVPEASSLIIFAGLFGLMGLLRFWRRKKA
jgi:hypothetical protein